MNTSDVFRFTASDRAQRLKLAQEALEPWRQAWPQIIEKLHRYQAQQFPDTSLPAVFSDLLKAKATEAGLALLPFVGPEVVDSTFINMANNNVFSAVAALLPHVTRDKVKHSALSSYLSVLLPRDRAIFDLLLPEVSPKQSDSYLLTAAIRNRHEEMAAELMPLSEPWAIARVYPNDAMMHKDLARLWAQSITAGLGPFPPRGDRSAAYWARLLPGVGEALKARHLEAVIVQKKATDVSVISRLKPRL